MRSGFLPTKIIHLHLTRRCNLSCLHCYSSSSPGENTELDLPKIVKALERLRSEGYEKVSLSGGEPFLFSRLPELTKALSELGYSINVVTNASVLNERRVSEIGDKFNMVAVSIDGRPKTHNTLRGRPDAFERTQAGIELLTKMKIPVAVAMCVTRNTLEDVPWVYDFAKEQGARALQLHPLAMIGRASLACGGFRMEEEDLGRLSLVAQLLDNASDGGPRVHVDLVETEALAASRPLFPLLQRSSNDPLTLGELVNPLIITERGTIVPFAYGIDKFYSIGTIEDNLDVAIKQFRSEGWGNLAKLVSYTFDEVQGSDRTYVEWYEELVQASEKFNKHPVCVKNRPRCKLGFFTKFAKPSLEIQEVRNLKTRFFRYLH